MRLLIASSLIASRCRRTYSGEPNTHASVGDFVSRQGNRRRQCQLPLLRWVGFVALRCKLTRSARIARSCTRNSACRVRRQQFVWEMSRIESHSLSSKPNARLFPDSVFKYCTLVSNFRWSFCDSIVKMCLVVVDFYVCPYF